MLQDSKVKNKMQGQEQECEHIQDHRHESETRQVSRLQLSSIHREYPNRVMSAGH